MKLYWLFCSSVLIIFSTWKFGKSYKSRGRKTEKKWWKNLHEYKRSEVGFHFSWVMGGTAVLCPQSGDIECWVTARSPRDVLNTILVQSHFVVAVHKWHSCLPWACRLGVSHGLFQWPVHQFSFMKTGQTMGIAANSIQEAWRPHPVFREKK